MSGATRHDAWVLNDRISRHEVSLDARIFKSELISEEGLDLSPYVFVHTDVIDQDILSDYIDKREVSLILDLRFRPIFEGPSFNHREIIEKFHEMDVFYLDCVYYASMENDAEKLLEKYKKAFARLGQKNFWSIFLFDDETVESQLLAEFRNGIRSGPKPFREVHPEIFFGAEVWKSIALDPQPKPA